MNGLEKVIQYAAQWDVPVTNYTTFARRARKNGSVHALGYAPGEEGPGGWGIHQWEHDPEIFEVSDFKDLPANIKTWPYLLHELAHCVNDITPFSTIELVETIGFEYLSMLHLGFSEADWDAWMADFGVQEMCGAVEVVSWPQAPKSWRTHWLACACEYTREVGLFKDGQPTFKIERLSYRTPKRRVISKARRT